ncbi:MAG: hypothetical protein H6Q30_3223 [Bacteroidetes bacterium]|nr:hypothetical protein [Bacteroidota bacterium]
MRTLGLYDSRKIEPSWSYSAKGVIWQIRPADGGMLIGEERRVEEKKALFFCLDGVKGHEFWRIASPGDDWWVGIEAVYKDTVLIHGFAIPNLPLHRGIVAVDLLAGKTLWEDPALEFSGVGNESVVGRRDTSSGQEIVELDRRSGELRRYRQVAEIQALKDEWATPPERNHVNFPLPLERLAIDDPDLATAVKRHSNLTTVTGPVEAVEHGRFIIFDYNGPAPRRTAQDPPLYSSTVKVVERATGSLLYSDTVCTGAHGVIPELFFVQHDMLYYIKERRTLIAVRLA